jgi:hypothetical protein
MWRRTALVLTAWLAVNASQPVLAKDADQDSLLLTRLHWVRFDLVLGRVQATTNRKDQSRQHATDQSESGRREKLFVSVDQGLISLKYQSIAADRSLHIDVVRRGEVQIRTTEHTATQPCSVVYAQPQRGNVSLEITKGAQAPTRFEAASLWHLMLAHPDQCRQYLVPTLELLRPNWNIEQDRLKVLAQLMQIRPEQYTVSQAEVSELVEQLDDPRFRVRQLADRQLRSLGQCGLIYLDRVDLETLATEPRERVQRIRAAIAERAVDTPACVAARLSHDERVWITLLGSPQPQTRAVAKRQLTYLCQDEIRFDPSADPDQRAQQIATLRRELLRR